MLTELQDKYTALEGLEVVLRYIVAAADIREDEVATITEIRHILNVANLRYGRSALRTLTTIHELRSLLKQ